MPELKATALGHYHLQRRLGRGGMSEVYLATDQTTQQEVAIKLVSSSHAEYSERFRHEIETMRTLTHKHILPVLDSGEHSPWHYLVTPYIKQGTLYRRLRKGPMTLQETGDILEQVAGALQYAHDHGIIHRDIKASNILLHEDRYAYLADFGLAKAIKDDTGITQTDCLMGTPEYLAPELIDGPATTSSDIYALGILLYQMVTGQVPFKADTPIGVCWKHLQEQPVPPSQLNPSVTRSIEQVILCAMEKDPRCRFKSPQALTQAFLQSLEETEVQEAARILANTTTIPALKIPRFAAIHALARQETKPKRYRRSSRANRILVALTVFVFLLTTSLSLGLLAAGDGLHTQFSAIIDSSAHLAAERSTQQNQPGPSFNLTLHHLEKYLVNNSTLSVSPPTRRHHRPDNNSGGGANAVGDTSTGNSANVGDGNKRGYNSTKFNKVYINPNWNNPKPGSGNVKKSWEGSKGDH